MKEVNNIVNMVVVNIPILTAIKQQTGNGHCKLQTLNRKDINDINDTLKCMNDRKPIKCEPCMSKLYRMAQTM